LEVTAACANRRVLTQRRGVIFGENLVLGSVGVEEQEVIEIADAVRQRANREVFGCVGHEVPDHPLTWGHTAASSVESQVYGVVFNLNDNKSCKYSIKDPNLT